MLSRILGSWLLSMWSSALDRESGARRECSRPSAANPSLCSGPSPLRGDVLGGACGAARRTRHASRVSSNITSFDQSKKKGPCDRDPFSLIWRANGDESGHWQTVVSLGY